MNDLDLDAVAAEPQQVEGGLNRFIDRDALGFNALGHERLLAVQPVGHVLLANRHHVARKPVEDQSGGKFDEHDCENHGHQHLHSLLRRVPAAGIILLDDHARTP
jgi:hypothetical protein